MSLGAAPRLLAVALAATLVTALLARLAPRFGWTDGPLVARKVQRRPVPAVGGAALFLVLACSPAPPWEPFGAELWGPWIPGRAWRAATLALLLAAGVWDDRARLPAGRKALAQCLALLPLALGAWQGNGPGAALLLLAVGFLALNALNTFDNADGALASLCALGFAWVAPFASAACLGFLPLNLDAARRRNRASGAPSAYLGDAGANLLAFLVLMSPRSAGLLVLPALDLARLALVRWHSGSRPWIGDRRHLAHRLSARGLSPPVVVLVQCAVAAPACTLVRRALALGDAWLAGLGVAVSAALYVLALCVSRARPGRSSDTIPCSPRAGSE
jgi:UDP-GlcNAc:undecaprenyl-phosphate GlcNAc-1-phosphate transferase